LIIEWILIWAQRCQLLSVLFLSKFLYFLLFPTQTLSTQSKFLIPSQPTSRVPINSLVGIYGNVIKLEPKLESHLYQYVHSMASSSNVQIGGPKLVDSILNLKKASFMFEEGWNLKTSIAFLIVLGMTSATMMNLTRRELTTAKIGTDINLIGTFR